MTLRITRDTRLCISLAARPSNIGTRFHNFLYESLGLDFVYKAFAPTDIAMAVAGIRGLGIRGAAVSMPFKEAVIALIDSLDPSAAAIGAVNTIVNTNGHLRGYNTDFIAVRELLVTEAIDRSATVQVHGSGGMAKAVVAALRELQFADVTVIARNERSGRALADRYGYTWAADPSPCSVIINATPIGMAGGAESEHLPVSFDQVRASDVVFDVVAFPPETPLIEAARAAGKHVITGNRVMTLQAVEQFELYTGIRPGADLVAAAAQHSLEA